MSSLNLERVDALILKLSKDLPIEERVAISTELFEMTGKRYGSDFKQWSKWRSTVQGTGKSRAVFEKHPLIQKLLSLSLLVPQRLTGIDPNHLPDSEDATAWQLQRILERAGNYLSLHSVPSFYGENTESQIQAVFGIKSQVSPVAGGGGRTLQIENVHLHLKDEPDVDIYEALSILTAEDEQGRALYVDQEHRAWFVNTQALEVLRHGAELSFMKPSPLVHKSVYAFTRLGFHFTQDVQKLTVWTDAFDTNPKHCHRGLLRALDLGKRILFGEDITRFDWPGLIRQLEQESSGAFSPTEVHYAQHVLRFEHAAPWWHFNRAPMRSSTRIIGDADPKRALGAVLEDVNRYLAAHKSPIRFGAIAQSEEAFRILALPYDRLLAVHRLVDGLIVDGRLQAPQAPKLHWLHRWWLQRINEPWPTKIHTFSP